MMDFPHFVEWCFLGICSAGVYIMWQMKESMQEINTKIEVLIIQHENTRDDVEDHESRIRRLENA